MKKIIGMGNALVDMLMSVPDEFVESLSFKRGSMNHINLETAKSILKKSENIKKKRVTGGSVANAINGLSKLGINSSYIGKVGDDEFGRFFENDMTRNGIKPNLFKGLSGTGTSICMISGDSERTFATYLGAAIELKANDLNGDLFKDGSYFFLEGYMVQDHDLVLKSLNLAKNAGLSIATDLSSFNVVEDNLDFLKMVLEKYIDIVFANEDESRAFTGNENPEIAVKKIGDYCKTAVVKIGSKGSLVFENGGKLIHIKPVKASPVDTTGAGDLYAAGFLYGIVQDLPKEVCGRIGSLLASKIVEVIGAKIPDAEWGNLKKDIKNIF